MNPDSNALSDMLGSVLSNPEAMSSILRVASSLGLNSTDGAKTDSTVSYGETDRSPEVAADRPLSAHAAEETATAAPLPSVPSPKKAAGDEDRIKLLNALRPYLGDDRRKRVDSVLGILRLLRVAEESGLLRDGLNLGGLFPMGGK